MQVIDETISAQLSNWKLERLALVDRAILRLSTYSLMYQGDMAAGIIIDEAVGLAKEFAADESFRFVNGVLDSVNRSVRGTKKST
jgi:N utilization substance protein B